MNTVVTCANPHIDDPGLRYRPRNCTTDGSPFGGTAASGTTLL